MSHENGDGMETDPKETTSVNTLNKESKELDGATKDEKKKINIPNIVNNPGTETTPRTSDLSDTVASDSSAPSVPGVVTDSGSTGGSKPINKSTVVSSYITKESWKEFLKKKNDERSEKKSYTIQEYLDVMQKSALKIIESEENASYTSQTDDPDASYTQQDNFMVYYHFYKYPNANAILSVLKQIVDGSSNVDIVDVILSSHGAIPLMYIYSISLDIDERSQFIKKTEVEMKELSEKKIAEYDTLIKNMRIYIENNYNTWAIRDSPSYITNIIQTIANINFEQYQQKSIDLVRNTHLEQLGAENPNYAASFDDWLICGFNAFFFQLNEKQKRLILNLGTAQRVATYSIFEHLKLTVPSIKQFRDFVEKKRQEIKNANGEYYKEEMSKNLLHLIENIYPRVIKEKIGKNNMFLNLELYKFDKSKISDVINLNSIFSNETQERAWKVLEYRLNVALNNLTTKKMISEYATECRELEKTEKINFSKITSKSEIESNVVVDLKIRKNNQRAFLNYVDNQTGHSIPPNETNWPFVKPIETLFASVQKKIVEKNEINNYFSTEDYDEENIIDDEDSLLDNISKYSASYYNYVCIFMSMMPSISNSEGAAAEAIILDRMRGLFNNASFSQRNYCLALTLQSLCTKTFKSDSSEASSVTAKIFLQFCFDFEKNSRNKYIAEKGQDFDDSIFPVEETNASLFESHKERIVPSGNETLTNRSMESRQTEILCSKNDALVKIAENTLEKNGIYVSAKLLKEQPKTGSESGKRTYAAMCSLILQKLDFIKKMSFFLSLEIDNIRMTNYGSFIINLISSFIEAGVLEFQKCIEDINTYKLRTAGLYNVIDFVQELADKSARVGKMLSVIAPTLKLLQEKGLLNNKTGIETILGDLKSKSKLSRWSDKSSAFCIRAFITMNSLKMKLLYFKRKLSGPISEDSMTKMSKSGALEKLSEISIYIRQVLVGSSMYSTINDLDTKCTDLQQLVAVKNYVTIAKEKSSNPGSDQSLQRPVIQSLKEIINNLRDTSKSIMTLNDNIQILSSIDTSKITSKADLELLVEVHQSLFEAAGRISNSLKLSEQEDIDGTIAGTMNNVFNAISLRLDTEIVELEEDLPFSASKINNNGKKTIDEDAKKFDAITKKIRDGTPDSTIVRNKNKKIDNTTKELPSNLYRYSWKGDLESSINFEIKRKRHFKRWGPCIYPKDIMSNFYYKDIPFLKFLKNKYDENTNKYGFIHTKRNLGYLDLCSRITDLENGIISDLFSVSPQIFGEVLFNKKINLENKLKFNKKEKEENTNTDTENTPKFTISFLNNKNKQEGRFEFYENTINPNFIIMKEECIEVNGNSSFIVNKCDLSCSPKGSIKLVKRMWNNDSFTTEIFYDFVSERISTSKNNGFFLNVDIKEIQSFTLLFYKLSESVYKCKLVLIPGDE